MSTIKYSWLAVVLLLLVGLSGNVQSQEAVSADVSGAPAPLLEGKATTTAREVNTGELAFHYRTQSDTTFGHTFLGQTFGDFPGSLTLALDVMPAKDNPTDSGSGTITGGSWTLPVYRVEVRGGFVGSIFGTVTGGQITPTENPDKSDVTMTLEIQGGTLAYAGATGTVTFVGTLTFDRTRAGHGSDLEGTLVFSSSQ